MTTAENLRVEIHYQKLKVNFNYCFRHGIFQNQVYNFFCIVSWVVSYCSAVLSKDLFVFLLRTFCHSNVCEKFDFCFTDFRKAIACLCVTHTAQISTHVVVYVEIYFEKRHWRKKST